VIELHPDNRGEIVASGLLLLPSVAEELCASKIDDLRMAAAAHSSDPDPQPRTKRRSAR
jgi:hypothetical protein